jgi:hypothetical protein
VSLATIESMVNVSRTESKDEARPTPHPAPHPVVLPHLKVVEPQAEPDPEVLGRREAAHVDHAVRRLFCKVAVNVIREASLAPPDVFEARMRDLAALALRAQDAEQRRIESPLTSTLTTILSRYKCEARAHAARIAEV